MQGFVAWLDLVTYLHHHGHDEKLPWYRGKVKNQQVMNWKYIYDEECWSLFFNFVKNLGMELSERGADDA